MMLAVPDETFDAIDGYLDRPVIPRRGKPYEHQCPLAAFEHMAQAAEELGGSGFALESLLNYERSDVHERRGDSRVPS